ncbi:MAG: phosphate ABC transporter substrate-binding protein PstS [Trebonia sp.]
MAGRAGRRRRGIRLRAVAPWLAIAAALTAVTAACGSAAQPRQAGLTDLAARAPAISETGSSLLYPLMRSWAAAYQRSTPGVSVTTASTSSGTGIAAAAAGGADLGASDAYLSTGDLVKSPTLLNIPLAIAAQTVIYNLPGMSAADHVQLNGAVLAGIYDGGITMWDDPRIAEINPHLTLPAVKIVPVRRSDSSGDTFLFTSYLSIGSQSTPDPLWNTTIGYGTTVHWPAVPGELREQGSLNVLHACESTPGCVAYNGVSYLSQALAGNLGEAKLENYAGRYALPTATAIADSVASFVSLTPPNETISLVDGPSATGYPIVNYEYAVVSTRQPTAGQASALRAFLTWIITTGNQASYLSRVGFQRLPATLVALGEQQIAEIGS